MQDRAPLEAVCLRSEYSWYRTNNWLIRVLFHSHEELAEKAGKDLVYSLKILESRWNIK